MITDLLIEQRINNTNRDRYGQISIRNCTPRDLFPGHENEIIEYLKTSQKYMLSTYGGSLGSYKAITKRF